MKWRWKGTYIEAGEFGGGHEQIIIIKRAGGTYRSMKVANRAGWARFACAVVWHGQWGGGGGGGAGGGSAGGGGGTGGGSGVVVVASSWWCHRGGGGAAAVVVVVAAGLGLRAPWYGTGNRMVVVTRWCRVMEWWWWCGWRWSYRRR